MTPYYPFQLLLPNVPEFMEEEPSLSGNDQAAAVDDSGVTGRAQPNHLNQHSKLANNEEIRTQRTVDHVQVTSGVNFIDDFSNNNHRTLQMQQRESPHSHPNHVHRGGQGQPQQGQGPSSFEDRLIPADAIPGLKQAQKLQQGNVQNLPRDNTEVPQEQNKHVISNDNVQMPPVDVSRIGQGIGEQSSSQTEPADVLSQGNVKVEATSGESQTMYIDIPANPPPSSHATDTDTSSDIHLEHIPTENGAAILSEEDIVLEGKHSHEETATPVQTTDQRESLYDSNRLPEEDRELESLSSNHGSQQQIHSQRDPIRKIDSGDVEESGMVQHQTSDMEHLRLQESPGLSEDANFGRHNVDETSNVKQSELHEATGDTADDGDKDVGEAEDSAEDALAKFYRELRERDEREEEEDDDDDEEDLLGDILDVRDKDTEKIDAIKEKEEALLIHKSKRGDQGVDEDQIPVERKFTDAHAKRGVDIRDHPPEHSEKVVAKYFADVDAIVQRDAEKRKEERKMWKEEIERREEREPLHGDMGKLNTTEIKSMESEREKMEAMRGSQERGAVMIDDKIDEFMGQKVQGDDQSDEASDEEQGESKNGGQALSDVEVDVRDAGHERDDTRMSRDTPGRPPAWMLTTTTTLFA